MAEENKQQEAEQPEKTYSAAEYTALQEQLNAARTSLKETAEKLASFEKMDVESIRKSAADWKQKYEQSEKDRADFAYKTKLGQFVKSLHLKNDVYEKFVTDLLTEKGLQFDGDKLIGGDDIVKAFRESHEDAFAPDPHEQAAAPTSGNPPSALSGIEAEFYAMNPNLKP